MKNVLVLALSLTVSSLGFSAATPAVETAAVVKQCDDTNGTKWICTSFNKLEASANGLATKLAEAGYNSAAMWAVSIMESAKWALDAARGDYRDQVMDAAAGVKERYYKAKSASEEARSKNASIQEAFDTYRANARELNFAIEDWLYNDEDDFDDDNENDDFDDGDSDDFDDDNENDDFDDDNENDDLDDQ